MIPDLRCERCGRAADSEPGWSWQPLEDSYELVCPLHLAPLGERLSDAKRQRLEAMGWRFGDADDFLNDVK